MFKKFIIVALFAIISLTSVATTYAVETTTPTATITTAPLTATVNGALLLSGTASNMDRLYITTAHPDGSSQTSGITFTNGVWYQNYPVGYFTQPGNYVVTLRANSATNTVLYTGTIVVTTTGSTIATIPSAHTFASRSLVQTTPEGALTARLTKGVQGNQVSALQKFLINNGYLKETPPTAYFGPLTEDALKRFQCEKLQVCDGTPDTTGYGAVGPRTRTMINGLIGG